MAEGAPLSIHEPMGGPKGGIVVVPEAFGVNGHIEDVTTRFASEGWLAVAPHLFHRSGDPKLGYEDMAAVMPHMTQLTADGVPDDIDAALARVAKSGIGPDRTGAVGFCRGGTVAFMTAVRRHVGAAVTLYGGGLAEGRFGYSAVWQTASRLVPSGSRTNAP